MDLVGHHPPLTDSTSGPFQAQGDRARARLETSAPPTSGFTDGGCEARAEGLQQRQSPAGVHTQSSWRLPACDRLRSHLCEDASSCLHLGEPGHSCVWL